MTVPNATDAVVPAEKLTGYLLDLSHSVGGSKARFLRAHGFDDDNTAALADGLRTIVGAGPATARPSPFGTKYVVVGDLPTPRGTVVRIETVWIIDAGHDRPRLVTAYPV